MKQALTADIEEPNLDPFLRQWVLCELIPILVAHTEDNKKDKLLINLYQLQAYTPTDVPYVPFSRVDAASDAAKHSRTLVAPGRGRRSHLQTAALREATPSAVLAKSAANGAGGDDMTKFGEILLGGIAGVLASNKQQLAQSLQHPTGLSVDGRHQRLTMQRLSEAREKIVRRYELKRS